MTLKEKIALGQLKKELARGIISQTQYDLRLRKLQGLPVEPKSEARANLEKAVEQVVKKVRAIKAKESRPERIDTERVAAKQIDQD